MGEGGETAGRTEQTQPQHNTHAHTPRTMTAMAPVYNPLQDIYDRLGGSYRLTPDDGTVGADKWVVWVKPHQTPPPPSQIAGQFPRGCCSFIASRDGRKMRFGMTSADNLVVDERGFRLRQPVTAEKIGGRPTASPPDDNNMDIVYFTRGSDWWYSLARDEVPSAGTT